MRFRSSSMAVAFSFLCFSIAAIAQPLGTTPKVDSPEVAQDGTVTFRIFAPSATKVTIDVGDIEELASAGGPGPFAGSTTPVTPPNYPKGGLVFTKNVDGVWEATVSPVPAGAYRYAFYIDGVRTLDPVNTHTSESNLNVWSMFTVSGMPLMDTADVPHGAVAAVYYYSQVLKTTRRMHIYTPPGYEAGNKKYPVFYLLHGAFDTDDAWSSVGRAGIILDNRIAAGKVKPMIVVMPAGHQPVQSGAPAAPAVPGAINPFTNEFMTDIMPYVEKYYRTINDRRHRAIAGLSMGGFQTLDIAFLHLDMFSEVGVFSSGVFGRRRPASGAGAQPPAANAPTPVEEWETAHQADLNNAQLKKGLKLLWVSTGADDRLMPTTRETVEMLKKHGFNVAFTESAGAHDWFNWRNYLIEFSPQLF
jgi:enterochelin esterase-like enzyme